MYIYICLEMSTKRESFLNKQIAQKATKTEMRRLEPISLYPLDPDKALAKFMKADPEKVEERLKKEGIKKSKK